jgi:hypothetical protein
MNNLKIDNAVDSAIAFEQRVIRQMAKTELDRIWAILTEASKFHETQIGKMGEQFAYDNAMEINAEYETTKSAYKAIGLEGSIGIHRI